MFCISYIYIYICMVIWFHWTSHNVYQVIIANIVIIGSLVKHLIIIINQLGFWTIHESKSKSFPIWGLYESILLNIKKNPKRNLATLYWIYSFGGPIGWYLIRKGQGLCIGFTTWVCVKIWYPKIWRSILGLPIKIVIWGRKGPFSGSHPISGQCQVVSVRGWLRFSRIMVRKIQEAWEGPSESGDF